MKRLGFFVLVAAAFVLSSCGAQKTVAQMQKQMEMMQMQQQQMYLQQQQMQQQYQQAQQYQQQQQFNQHQQQFNQQQFAKDVLRYEQQKLASENPCQYLALMWDNDIRGYGEATGFDREAAYAMARINAEAELLSIMNLWASDFSRRTNLSVSQNARTTQERVFQQDQIRFAEGDLKGVKILLVKDEQTSAGVVCRMCVSIDANAATNALLNQAEVQAALKNAEQFRKEADVAREEIRLMRTGTNAEMQKRQAEQDMQMQQSNQQFQQNQQSVQQQQDYNLQKNQQYYDYQLQMNQQNNMYNQQNQYNPTVQQSR